ncbi:hypothetical protein AN396_00540 [Candidatus Epulonipiscium fishelsonii]|uniref:Uncharacterized protein n=1 Tax=Candidatus Epulonipiscium fishelsonii TaxID=77094 RepID=A0ACC8XFG1_9FIRM|nr:hypothetical protein AN396_00540 [Epulopiscium sp. SCG-B11WGA-EpuloA1]
MKAKVVYFTKSGHTKQIADAIGEELKCPVTNIDVPVTEAVDILFLGASVYKFGIDKQVLDFIDNLEPTLIGSVVLFETSALADNGYHKMSKKLTAKGIKVCENHYHCKGAFMLINKNHPNEDDINKAKQFATSIKE